MRGFSKKSTDDFSAEVSRLKKALARADAVVVGAGAGGNALSSTSPTFL